MARVIVSLEDFDEDDMIQHLKEEGYDFSIEVDTEDIISRLESEGYTVLENSIQEENSLDIIDSRMLKEIKGIFINASVFERERIYNLITKL